MMTVKNHSSFMSVSMSKVDLDSEGEQIIILTLKDGTEIAVSPESLEHLEKSLNIGEAENLTE